MPDHCCIGCQTPDVDPAFPVCDPCQQRYPHPPKDFSPAAAAGGPLAPPR